MRLLAALPDGVTHRQVLIRHGEPVASAHGRCYGKLDVALSPAGLAEMRRTAAALAAAPLAAVLASPRRRAVESARALADPRGLPVAVDARLAELDFGALEGLAYDEVAARHPELYRAWMETPTAVTFPGGESFAAMRVRVAAAAADVRRRHAGASVALVTHGGVIRIVLADTLGVADADVFRLEQSYAAVSCVDWYDATPIVRCVNWLPEGA